ncbi:MAG TPA: hypothetical protein VKU60_20020, partial [Chloroflexota bacterium]|nr:hypothetical protein [Chloroflexota bacterium]
MTRPVPGILRAGSAGLVLLLGACGSAAAPSSPPSNPSAAAPVASASSKPAATASGAAKPAASASQSTQAATGLDALVPAAKQEGKIAIIGAPGDTFRQVYDTFSKKYGITYDYLPGNGNADLVPKIDAERKAGQYNWDVIVHSPASQFAGFKPIGALDPLRPVLLPETMDDSKWVGGFNAGW